MGPKKKISENEKKSTGKPPQKKQSQQKSIKLWTRPTKNDEAEEERILECRRSWTRQQRTYYRSREHHHLFWHVVLDWGFDPEDADEYLDAL
jgi:hypothetical protein